MSKEKIRIKIKAYDHRILDTAAKKIVETVTRTGGEISGPVPLPTEIEKFTILRAVHKYKDSREQFEMRTHKRLKKKMAALEQQMTVSADRAILSEYDRLTNAYEVGGGYEMDTNAKKSGKKKNYHQ